MRSTFARHDGSRPEVRTRPGNRSRRGNRSWRGNRALLGNRVRRGIALSAVTSVLALAGPASPALAQGGQAQPPQLDPSKTPASGPLKPEGAEQKQGCMAPNPGNSEIEQKPWSQLALGYEEAHEQGITGAGQKVAIIDTGVNPHPQLGSVDSSGGSAVPDGGANRDCDGHGTLVAGFVAAQGKPNTGFLGVAPDSQLMSIRQSSSLWQKPQNNKPIGDTETMAQAIQYAVVHQADVINISQSSCQQIAEASKFGNEGNQRLHNAVENARKAGTVVVAAAGNVGECQQNNPGSPTNAVLPAWFDEDVLTVGSINQQGAPSQFSVAGPWVDVAAPGEGLIGLDPGPKGTGLASQIASGQQGQPGPIQGTSFSAPHVSGLVALIKEKFEKEGKPLTAEQIMDRVEKTAIHPGGNNGRNDIVGYGPVDVMAALNDVVPSEHGQQQEASHRRKLGAGAFPQRNWPATVIAFGGAGTGIAAVVFTAFLVNAVRNIRARRAGESPDDGS